ncbi:MAG: hypothetical protein EOP68_11435 [Sphingomonas sp.]|jgi:hypothetical protein|uniref:Flagellar FliJ protein n=1 Tax=Sphingomonas longa TaxID=2778730 RepID=A0ABS2DDI4_9SPHN|nr:MULTISPECIES: hypothetical protein [Alphaproteobacteria]MBM6578129.1 hypothetical protein [Sphingomonas sp. BT552]MBR7711170.1 hypothetical protein [Microvirga sp. SRT01]RZM08527.1 MAG: hypothetical protein EOP68_11435 [Sphingomonas sp.]
MSADKSKMLARLHRVRTLQLGLARADEVRHAEALASEHQLTQRISALVDAVAPTTQATGAHSLSAAAYYRERLQKTADAAFTRVEMAERRADAATEATRAAKRDQSAVEKLMERARQAATMKEMRALEDAPGIPRGKRHGPC